MKHPVFIIFLLISFLSANAQQDAAGVFQNDRLKPLTGSAEPKIEIYPVPVRENIININSSKEIASVKITNIIGQDIFRANYNNSQSALKIILDNPQRGMYLVSIFFTDNTRVVKKILIESVI